MDRLKKLFKEFSLHYDILNMVLGIILVIFLVLVFRNPGNRLWLLGACAAGGSMNVINGLKFMKDPKKRNSGMAYIMLGIIIMFLGYLFTQIF